LQAGDKRFLIAGLFVVLNCIKAGITVKTHFDIVFSSAHKRREFGDNCFAVTGFSGD
jgi:hypothetical protein